MLIKTRQELVIGQKNAKHTPAIVFTQNEIVVKGFETMKTLLESEGNEKWKHLEQTYKLRSKIAELPFAHLKQYMRLTEFTTIGLQQVNTEFKLYTIGHNLKRIYNEINRKNN